MFKSVRRMLKKQIISLLLSKARTLDDQMMLLYCLVPYGMQDGVDIVPMLAIVGYIGPMLVRCWSDVTHTGPIENVTCYLGLGYAYHQISKMIAKNIFSVVA